MRAIITSVDFDDLLAVTLPYNKHHFESVCVVTAPGKRDAEVALTHGATVFETDLFWANKASFNKWAALEAGLDFFGREGWLCLMDADVLWPKAPPAAYLPGYLYSPLRRMAPLEALFCFRPYTGIAWPCESGDCRKETQWVYRVAGRDALYCGAHAPKQVPPEREWGRYPPHRNDAEWAGYTQIFHASDPALGPPPWHEVDWSHAGGADSLFQRKWPNERKVRLPWEVLHLGEAGQNWYGRATQRLDGTTPTESSERLGKCAEIWRSRRELRAAGKSEAEQFAPEKLS